MAITLVNSTKCLQSFLCKYDYNGRIKVFKIVVAITLVSSTKCLQSFLCKYDYNGRKSRVNIKVFKIVVW